MLAISAITFAEQYKRFHTVALLVCVYDCVYEWVRDCVYEWVRDCVYEWVRDCV